MTAHKIKGEFAFECDESDCKETIETERTDFSAARDAMKRAEWLIKPGKFAGTWRHICPDCQRSYASEARLPYKDD